MARLDKNQLSRDLTVSQTVHFSNRFPVRPDLRPVKLNSIGQIVFVNVIDFEICDLGSDGLGALPDDHQSINRPLDDRIGMHRTARIQQNC